MVEDITGANVSGWSACTNPLAKDVNKEEEEVAVAVLAVLLFWEGVDLPCWAVSGLPFCGGNSCNFQLWPIRTHSNKLLKQRTTTTKRSLDTTSNSDKGDAALVGGEEGGDTRETDGCEEEEEIWALLLLLLLRRLAAVGGAMRTMEDSIWTKVRVHNVKTRTASAGMERWCSCLPRRFPFPAEDGMCQTKFHKKALRPAWLCCWQQVKSGE